MRGVALLDHVHFVSTIVKQLFLVCVALAVGVWCRTSSIVRTLLSSVVSLAVAVFVPHTASCADFLSGQFGVMSALCRMFTL